MGQKVREAKKQEREDKQFGTGRMMYRNVSASTIILPKPSFDQPPKTQIEPGGIFTGDSYHQKAMEGTGAIRLVAVQDDSDEIKEAAQASELIVFDPNTGNMTRMTQKQFADSKKKTTQKASGKESGLDVVQ